MRNAKESVVRRQIVIAVIISVLSVVLSHGFALSKIERNSYLLQVRENGGSVVIYELPDAAVDDMYNDSYPPGLSNFRSSVFDGYSVLEMWTRPNSNDRSKLATKHSNFGPGRYTWRIYIPPMGRGDQTSVGAFIYIDDKHELDFECGYGNEKIRKKLGIFEDTQKITCYMTSQGYPYSSSQVAISHSMWHEFDLDLRDVDGYYEAYWYIDGVKVKGPLRLEYGPTYTISGRRFTIVISVENLEFIGDHPPSKINEAYFDYIKFVPYTAKSSFIFPGTIDSATVLLIDTSGSMRDPTPSGPTKMDAAKEAAQRLVNLLAAENQAMGDASHQVSVVSFSTTALQRLAMSEDVMEARDVLAALQADGGTAMAAGLQEARRTLQSVPSAQKKIILLLSDGVPTIGLYGEEMQSFDPDIYRVLTQQVLDVARDIAQEGVCIYTVGFGDPEGEGQQGTPPIDEHLLQQIAAFSGCGQYYNARDAFQLVDIYVRMRHTSVGQVLLHKKGMVKQGEQVNVGTIQVSDNQAYLRYTLNWPGSRLRPILVDPRGQSVDDAYPNVQIHRYVGMVDVILPSPLPGIWQVALYGDDVPEGVIPYTAIVSVVPSATAPRPRSEGQSAVWVLLFVILAGVGIAGGYVVAQRKRMSRVRRQARGAMAWLVLPDNRRIGLYQSDVLIGRSENCHIRLADPTVSRYHARLTLARGQWYIQDIGSSWGTFVNARRIASAPLRSGDRITIGNTTLVFLEHI